MRFLLFLFFNIVCAEYLVIQSESSIIYSGKHPMHIWSGATKELTLEQACSKSPENVCRLDFKFPIMSLNSGNDNRDSNMINTLNAFTYPNIIMVFDDFIIREYNNELVNASIEIHGKIQDISVPINLTITDSGNYYVISDFSIFLSHYGIELPTLLLMPIDDEIKINAEILIRKSN